MNNENDTTIEVLKTRRSEKRKKVAEATGRILIDLNGAYVECDCRDQALDEINEVVADVIKKIKACDDKVSERTAG